MAIFGFHFVLTLIAATVFTKVTARFSFCDLAVFKGLYYYLLDSSLIKIKQPVTEKSAHNKKRDKNKRNDLTNETNSERRLLKIPLTAAALEGVPFFSSLTWTLNYFIFALLVYFISDAFTLFFPSDQDHNISLIWLLCSLAFLINVLVKLTAVKMSAEELHAERNLLLCFGALFFLVFLIAMAFVDEVMDITFQQGYNHFTSSVNDYLASQGYDNIFENSGKSPLLLVIVLSLMFSTFATIMLFPNIQYASLYLDSLKDCSPHLKVSLHVTFFLPLIGFFTFIKAVKTHILETSSISEELFDILRIFLIVAWCIMRYATAKYHFQTFLDKPKYKIYEFNKDVRLKEGECEKKVAYFASYFCVTTLQYLVPMFITLSSTLLLKNLGNTRVFNAIMPTFSLSFIPHNHTETYTGENTIVDSGTLISGDLSSGGKK
ncbi:putative transmembrane protein domain-containing protein [Ditylenchus destructor]|uniref:Transmembrane protein domain-containing protein n=1 Tax=Ditylenchus destructor TaxID=166010 RepID=A0AAD4ML71_9BILA|nr:putative transmembrane protein domain-containing protein [Ditylenchus destructor]KAI1720503.1 putative transmembrane protein domain-containing protein [Ditylenchus destructor]